VSPKLSSIYHLPPWHATHIPNHTGPSLDSRPFMPGALAKFDLWSCDFQDPSFLVRHRRRSRFNFNVHFMPHTPTSVLQKTHRPVIYTSVNSSTLHNLTKVAIAWLKQGMIGVPDNILPLYPSSASCHITIRALAFQRSQAKRFDRNLSEAELGVLA
jgi:hypothetical protein